MDNYLAIASFCDDVRHETSGKRIIIGEYGPDLIVPTVPHECSRLCVVVRISFPKDAALSGVGLRLVLPGGRIEEQALPAPPPPKYSSDERLDRRTVVACFVFDKLMLPEAGALVAEVTVPEVVAVMPAGSLQIVNLAAPDESDRVLAFNDRAFPALVGTAVYYKDVVQALPISQRRLVARKLLDDITPLLGDTGARENLPIYIWTSYRTCNIWYPRTISKDDIDHVEVRVTGTDAYSISNKTSFGFSIEFGIGESDIVSFDVTSPKF